jgi:hypothetical protein
VLGKRDFDSSDPLSQREIAEAVEELFQRDPSFFSKIFRGVKKVAGGLLGREIDELD